MKLDKLIEILLETGARRVVSYREPKRIIRVTRTTSRKNSRGKPCARHFEKRAQQVTFTVTFGRPNYREARFIKQALKAGEPFPVKKPQLTFCRA